MDATTQQRLVTRLLDHFAYDTTDLAGAERYVDIAVYTDPGRFNDERDRIFAAVPVLVGHVSQLQSPGDFLTDVVNGVPVLLVRSPDGEVKGFRNVCRHRGAILVGEESGNRKAFLCPYHAWRYDTAGALTHVPDEERCFPGLDHAERGLLRVPVFERYGFLWVDLGDTHGSHLRELAPDLTGYRLDRDRLYRVDHRHARSNWKLLVEAFLEVYHFKALHPQMTSYLFSHEFSLMDILGENMRMVAPKRELRELREKPHEEWLLRPHSTILYFIYPHTFAFVETRHLTTLQIRPITVDQSELRLLHVANDRGWAESARLDVTIEAMLQAIDEDIDICESMQRGFAAGPHKVVFGRNEIGLQHFHDTLDMWLAG